MQEDLTALREQLAQLQARRRAGSLSEAEFEPQRAALEQRIVAAVMAGGEATPSAAAAATATAATPTAATGPARVPGRLWAVTAAFVLVLAGAGYAWKGSPGLVSGVPQAETQAGGGHTTGREQIEQMSQRLAERLQQQGDDPEGWSLLGRTQMALGRHAEAAQSYARGLALKPDDATMLADRADALAMAAGRNLEGEPMQLLAKALKIEPDHPKALALAGSAAFQRGDFAQAAALWERVVRTAAPDNPLVEMAREGVAEARARGNLPAEPTPAAAAPAVTARAAPGAAPAAPASAPRPAASAAGRITGTVQLAAALKDRAAPGDMVFIFARPAAGGMPLAILQKQVKDLPATFTLSDDQAMSPANRLSQATSVVVTARISKSGQAMPQPGDLEGASAAVAPGAQGLVVEIAHVRK